MSSSIDALNGNGMSLQFEEFARLAGTSMKGSRVVRFLGSSDAVTVHEVAVTKSDKVGKLFRSGDIDKPRISSPTANVRQGWQEGGLLSANDAIKKGYAPSELTKLAAFLLPSFDFANSRFSGLCETEQGRKDERSETRRQGG